MPTTRSSLRLQSGQLPMGTGTKRPSENKAPSKSPKRGKLSENEWEKKKSVSYKDELQGSATEESVQGSTDIGEDKEYTAKNDRDKAGILSSTLENGIIYFFYRARVNVDDAHGTKDVARSYIVLRSLGNGVKVTEGPLDDAANSRLLALPKKMLPKKHGDGFLAIVEKAACSIRVLQDQLSSSEYATKTSRWVFIILPIM